MSEILIETNIQERFYEKLKDRFPNDVLVMNWQGYMEKVGLINRKKGESNKETRISRFYREFDIARYSRIKNGEKTDLILCGYEVKGVTHSKKKGWVYPSFGEGLDQASSLLLQNTDYSHLITPRPLKNEKGFLELINSQYPKIGLIYAEKDGSFLEIKKSEKNDTLLQKKLDNLMGLIINGKYKKDSLIGQLWGRSSYAFYHI